MKPRREGVDDQTRSDMSQHEQILEYLKQNKSISMFEGFEHLRITKINSRCGELIKQGYPITGVWEKNGGKKYMRYFWEVKPEQLKLFC